MIQRSRARVSHRQCCHRMTHLFERQMPQVYSEINVVYTHKKNTKKKQHNGNEVHTKSSKNKQNHSFNGLEQANVEPFAQNICKILCLQMIQVERKKEPARKYRQKFFFFIFIIIIIYKSNAREIHNIIYCGRSSSAKKIIPKKCQTNKVNTLRHFCCIVYCCRCRKLYAK